MTKEKKQKVTVGELVEMLAKNNWKNEVYLSDDAKTDYLLDAIGNRDRANYFEILGVSSHSGGLVTINYESKSQEKLISILYEIQKLASGITGKFGRRSDKICHLVNTAIQELQ